MVDMYFKGPFVYKWYSHTLYSTRLSAP